ncbi:hypothetical protein HY78_29515 (plasmid) [Rhizorhabdus wittichii DC-6]|nr:hypothetical protein HY78_29515 [Rhizorhabdus wittichii DC-6]
MKAKTFALTCASAVAMSSASMATAQQTAQTSETPPASSTPSASQATGASEVQTPEAGLQDIIVTATRRQEKLQNVPVAVTAIDSRVLEKSNVTSTLGLLQTFPSLQLSRTTSTVTPAIRGVVSTAASVGDEPNVGFYVDGIYQPVSSANIFDLFAIERVEVLRGPQGTLFGRNSMGGLINIITRDPSFRPEGELGISGGNFGYVAGRAYVSAGLTSNLAASLGATASRNSGFDKDLIRGGDVGKQKNLLVRGKLLYQPASNVKLIGTLLYSYSRDDSIAAGQPSTGNTQALASTPSVVLALKPNQYAGGILPEMSARKLEANLAAEVDLGSVKLNTAGSYQRDKQKQAQDSDGTTVFIRNGYLSQQSKTYSQEVRLSSNTNGPFKWITGAYFYYFDGSYNPVRIVTPTATTLLTPDVTSRSEAVFAEGTYNITPRLSFTAGGRYTWEHRTFKQVSNGVQLFDVDASYSNFTPRGILSYKASDKVNLYGSVSTGFKSGVFAAMSTISKPVSPEKLTSYEVGIKTDPLRWLRVNASSFYYDYKNLQVSARDSNSLVFLQNAATAHIYGGELEVTAAPTSQLNLRIGLSYQHARFASFPNAVAMVRAPAGGNTTTQIDASGNQIPRSPDASGSIGADYTFPLQFGSLTFSGNVYHSTRLYYDFGEKISQAPYTVANASATVKIDACLSA